MPDLRWSFAGGTPHRDDLFDGGQVPVVADLDQVPEGDRRALVGQYEREFDQSPAG